MDSLLKFVGKNFMKDQRFEVNNRRKFILVIGVTGTGKSSFINFMTNKDECKVSDEGESSTKDYKIVEKFSIEEEIYKIGEFNENNICLLSKNYRDNTFMKINVKNENKETFYLLKSN